MMYQTAFYFTKRFALVTLKCVLSRVGTKLHSYSDVKGTKSNPLQTFSFKTCYEKSLVKSTYWSYIIT